MRVLRPLHAYQCLSRLSHYTAIEGANPMTKVPTKAVIAAAGYGTRLLPTTKAIPKEMLPLIDKPVIQHIVEELVSVGIKDIIIVTNQSKRAIEDHFSPATEDLIAHIKHGAKHEALLESLANLSQMANFVYVRQKGPYGSCTPLLNVAHLINDEPFLYTWSDDFMTASPSRFQQMVDAYTRYQTSIFAGLRVTQDSDYSRYGFASGTKVDETVIATTSIVPGPGKANAPSDLATISGYLLTAEALSHLHEAKNQMNSSAEFYFTDALNFMMSRGVKVHTTEIKGARYYDAGSRLGYAKTIVDLALQHDDIGSDFRKYLEEILMK